MGRALEGSIRRRGAEQFRARIEIGSREYSKTFPTRDQARLWVQATIDAERQNRLPDHIRAQSLTLAEALERYRLDVTPGKKSAKKEASTIGILLREEEVLCGRSLAEIRTSDMQELKKRLLLGSDERDPVTGSTVNRYLSVISHLYNTAISQWSLETLRNPVVKGTRCKENESRSRRLEPDEEAALMRQASIYQQNPTSHVRIGEVIQFALKTCMRRGELGCLEWKHVRLDRRTVLVVHPKNGETRSVPLFPSAVELLRKLPRREDGLVFGPAESITTSWRWLLEHLTIEDLHFHDLRHEAVSRLFEDTDLQEGKIALISGHKTPQMLWRYRHLRADRVAMELAAAEARLVGVAELKTAA